MAFARKFCSRPASDDDVRAVLEVNGLSSLDETPPGTRVFESLDELIAELEHRIRATGAEVVQRPVGGDHG